MAFVLGFVLLLLGGGLSAALSADHVGSLTLPGCGPASACERLAASPWGSLPGTRWPLSFVGLAWFIALLGAWATSRSGVHRALLLAIRGGAVVSLLLIGAMLAEGLACGYCLAVHAAHLAFCVLAHLRPRRAADPAAALVPLVGLALATTIGLWAWQTEVQRKIAADREGALAESTRRIAASAAGGETQVAPDAGDDTPPGESADARPWHPRHRVGPERAAVRIVVLSDYQCEDCKRVHADLEQVVEEHESVSLAALHFPMCADCNPRFADDNLHPNACWAARAAEAAGMLGGAQGFWDFSRWLFERGGGFTRPELEAHLVEAGFDVEGFVATMEGEETLRRVRRDIDEGLERGLHFTPMVFLNGVELQGVLAPHAVPRAVEQVLATRPEPATGEADVPRSALDKYLEDWRKQPVRDTGKERRDLAAAPADARIRIVVWGDYQEQHTGTADRILRGWAEQRPHASYSFRHFPAHSGCNSKMTRVMHANACTMAQAAEAASLLGDEAQYWLVHEWLFENRQRFHRPRLLQRVAELGLDPAAFEQAMASQEVAQAIEQDARQGFPMLYHGSIPAIYINGRVVPRWRLEGENVLENILDGLE